MTRRFWFFFLILGLLFGLGLEKALAAPSAPQSFRASGLSSCAASLTWNQPDNADYFEVSLNGRTWTSLRDENGELITGSGDKTFNHTGLDQHSSFSYYLHSCANIGAPNNCSNSAGPANVTLSALPAPPAAPTSLQTLRWINDGNGDRVLLSWQPDQNRQSQHDKDYTGFQIWRADNNDDSFNYLPIFTLTRFLAGIEGVSNTWNDAVDANNSHFYKIKTYQTDQYCDTNNAHQIRYSDSYSNVLTIPKKSAYLRELETRNNRLEARFEWENVSDETSYYLQAASNVNFVNPEVNVSFNADDTDSDWLRFASNQTVYLRVSACNISNNNNSCSASTTATYQSGVAGPTDLEIRIQSADFNANLGKVKLEWKDEAGAEHQTRIYRKTADQQNFGEPVATLSGSEFGNLIIPPDTEYEENDDLGRIYDYEVRFYYPDEQRESAAGEQLARINLDFVHRLIGWAWSSNFGWLAMNSEVFDDEYDIPYGVYVDSEGFLSGYAWSANAGWLSFNQVDLADCPAGTCEAKADLNTQALRGWAKFIGADPTKGAWQGWLSLSEIRQGGQQGFNDKVKNFFANLIGLFLRK